MSDCRRKAEWDDQVFFAELEEVERQVLGLTPEEEESALAVSNAIFGMEMEELEPVQCQLIGDPASGRCVESRFACKPFDLEPVLHIMIALNSDVQMRCPSVGSNAFDSGNPFTVGPRRVVDVSPGIRGNNHAWSHPLADLKN